MGVERYVTRRAVLRAGSRLFILATGSSLYSLPRVAASEPVATRFTWEQRDLPSGQTPFLSPILRSEMPFNALESQWDATVPLGADLSLAVRTSVDGNDWTVWQHLHADSHARTPDE